MIRKTIKGGDFKSQMVGELVFDQVPEEGSFNPVTSDAVVKAIDEAKEDMQEKIDEVTLDPSAVALGNVHLLDEVTEFPADGCILIDSETNGPGEMSKDTLLELTAQNALAGNVAPEFDPTRTSENPYKVNENVVKDGIIYHFKVPHYGAWDSSHVIVGPYDAISEEQGFRIANEVSSRSYSLLKFYTDSSVATQVITGGYFDAYGNFVEAVGYTNLVFGAKDFSTKIYFASSLAYRQVCVFDGIVDQSHFVARYRSSDSTLPLEANPLTILPGQIFVIGNTTDQSEDFVFYTTWNGTIEFTDDSVKAMLNQAENGIVKIADKEIDDNVFEIVTGVTLDKTSSLVTVMDGYVGGPDGNISANALYVSYIYDVNENTTLYANPTESSYLSVSVTNKEMTSGVRYRLKTSSPSEDTLPYENSPVSVTAGKRLIISTTKTNDKAWSFELPSEQYRESFNPNVPLAEAHVEQVLNQIVDGKILVRYVNSAGTEDSTERVEVYVPTKVGYVQYLFLHNVNVSRNCDVWRVAYAYSCAANLEQRFALTRAGEWECAIRLEDRDDFAGGYTHGDEILVGSPIFFVDGKEILLSDIATLTRCEELRCVTKSSMVDPSDHETIFATHGCEHQFTAKGLRVRQSIEWLGTYNIINTYMAMNLPYKDYTDTYYTDKDVFAQAIPNPLSKHEVGAGYLCMFKDSTKTFNEFYLGKDYPTDPWLYLTDNGSTYNKGYFVINMSTPMEITSGTRWKAEFYTRYEVGA